MDNNDIIAQGGGSDQARFQETLRDSQDSDQRQCYSCRRVCYKDDMFNDGVDLYCEDCFNEPKTPGGER